MKKIIAFLNSLLFVSALFAQNKDSVVTKRSIEITGGTDLLTPIHSYSEIFSGPVSGAYYVTPKSTSDNFFIYGTYTKELLNGKNSFLALAANIGYQHYHIKCGEFGYDSVGLTSFYFKGENTIEWQNDYAIVALSLMHTLRITERIHVLNMIGFTDNWLLHYSFTEDSHGITYNNQVVDTRFIEKGWHNSNSEFGEENESFIFYRLTGVYQLTRSMSFGIQLECPLLFFFNSDVPGPRSITSYPTWYFVNVNELYYLNMGVEFSYELK